MDGQNYSVARANSGLPGYPRPLALVDATARREVRTDGPSAVSRARVHRSHTELPTQREAHIRQHTGLGRLYEVAAIGEQSPEGAAQNRVTFSVFDVALAVLLVVGLLLAAYMEHQDVLMGVVTG